MQHVTTEFFQRKFSQKCSAVNLRGHGMGLRSGGWVCLHGPTMIDDAEEKNRNDQPRAHSQQRHGRLL